MGLNVNPGPFARDLKELGQRAPVCLGGALKYAGCASDPKVVCVDYAFDYTIEVKTVCNPRTTNCSRRRNG